MNDIHGFRTYNYDMRMIDRVRKRQEDQLLEANTRPRKVASLFFYWACDKSVE